MASLSPDSEDIFLTDCFQRYAVRDKNFENVNLIDYISGRLTDKKTKVVLYYQYDPKTQFDDFARVQLLLFTAWRKESELTGNFENYGDRYLSIEKQIEEARSFYHKMKKKVLDDVMKEYEHDHNLVPVVDEEESLAKKVNDHQNKMVNSF